MEMILIIAVLVLVFTNYLTYRAYHISSLKVEAAEHLKSAILDENRKLKAEVRTLDSKIYALENNFSDCENLGAIQNSRMEYLENENERLKNLMLQVKPDKISLDVEAVKAALQPLFHGGENGR